VQNCKIEITQSCRVKIPSIAKTIESTRKFCILVLICQKYKEEKEMLSMAEKECIRKMFFFKGMNKSEIARKTGTDRKTVRKVINKDNWNEELKGNKNGDKDKSVVKCKKESKLAKYYPLIDEWLMNDKKAKVKQRHTAKRVYVRLVELCKSEGYVFPCSYRLVAEYVKEKKKEIFKDLGCKLPLIHLPGRAQADFGDAQFTENGRTYDGAYLNMSFPYSNAGYLQIFKGENIECLMEGMINIFNHIGGVPQEIWFDNSSIMVTKVLKDEKRQLTESFIRFMNHFGFNAIFCNIAKGNEKGSVENKVGYHRRNMLVPIPGFDNIYKYNRKLLSICDQDMERIHYRKEKSIKQLFKEDIEAFSPLPSIQFEPVKYVTARTNSYAMFSLEEGKHLYSTSPKFANSIVIAKVSANEVIVLDRDYKEITRHKRLYGKNRQESMNWIPYLSQLSKCPTALKYSGIHEMLPDPLKSYLDSRSREKRSIILKVIEKLTAESSFENAINSLNEVITLKIASAGNNIISNNQNLDTDLDIDPDTLIAVHRKLNYDLPDMKLKLKPDIPDYMEVVFDSSIYDAVLDNSTSSAILPSSSSIIKAKTEKVNSNASW